MISYLLVVEQHRTQIVIHALLKCQQENLDRKSGSAGMPRPISYAVFCLKKKTRSRLASLASSGPASRANRSPSTSPRPRPRSRATTTKVHLRDSAPPQ